MDHGTALEQELSQGFHCAPRASVRICAQTPKGGWRASYLRSFSTKSWFGPQKAFRTERPWSFEASENYIISTSSTPCRHGKGKVRMNPPKRPSFWELMFLFRVEGRRWSGFYFAQISLAFNITLGCCQRSMSPPGEAHISGKRVLSRSRSFTTGPARLKGLVELGITPCNILERRLQLPLLVPPFPDVAIRQTRKHLGYFPES